MQCLCTISLNVAMPMYNFIEYRKNYPKTSGTLWNYYKDLSIDPERNSESFIYNKYYRKNSQ